MRPNQDSNVKERLYLHGRAREEKHNAITTQRKSLARMMKNKPKRQRKPRKAEMSHPKT